MLGWQVWRSGHEVTTAKLVVQAHGGERRIILDTADAEHSGISVVNGQGVLRMRIDEGITLYDQKGNRRITLATAGDGDIPQINIHDSHGTPVLTMQVRAAPTGQEWSGISLKSGKESVALGASEGGTSGLGIVAGDGKSSLRVESAAKRGAVIVLSGEDGRKAVLGNYDVEVMPDGSLREHAGDTLGQVKLTRLPVHTLLFIQTDTTAKLAAAASGDKPAAPHRN